MISTKDFISIRKHKNYFEFIFDKKKFYFERHDTYSKHYAFNRCYDYYLDNHRNKHMNLKLIIIF